jgi:hypothetical protein
MGQGMPRDEFLGQGIVVIGKAFGHAADELK